MGDGAGDMTAADRPGLGVNGDFYQKDAFENGSSVNSTPHFQKFRKN